MANLLKSDFTKSSCPAGLPLWDDGLNELPQSTSFVNVIKAAAKHADIVMIGDTDHFDPDVHGLIAKDENLKALKDASYTHMAVEVSDRMQHWVDKFNRDELTQKEFEDKIHMSLKDTQSNENGAWTRQLGKMASFAKDNGMKLVFIDPGNGENWCSNELKGADLEACELENDRSRFRDSSLSYSLNSLLKETPNAKVFQMYGAGHYSVDNGSKELLEGRSVKIDVYKNRAFYEADKTDAKQDNSFGKKMGFGSIKPDLVYMMDTQDIYSSCAANPTLMEDIAAGQDSVKAENRLSPKSLPNLKK